MTRNNSLAAELIKDMPVAAAAGYIGTKLMEPISPKLYERQPEKDRKRQDEVRPRAPLRLPRRTRPRSSELISTTKRTTGADLVSSLRTLGPESTADKVAAKVNPF